MPLIARDVTFGYSRKCQILHGVDIKAERGELVSLIGPNGSGKTTFIKCLNRINKVTGGRLELDGVDIRTCRLSHVAKKIGYVPQSLGSLLGGTVLEVIIIGRRQHIAWKIKDEDLDKSMEILGQMGIAHLANRSYTELSGGQKQQVLIARALVQEPDIYLFDEPTSYLDIHNQLEVMRMSRYLVETLNKTVIMVVHDLNMALRFSDKIILMKDGIIVASGKPKDVMTVENIKQVYDVDVEILDERSIVPL